MFVPSRIPIYNSACTGPKTSSAAGLVRIAGNLRLPGISCRCRASGVQSGSGLPPGARRNALSQRGKSPAGIGRASA